MIDTPTILFNVRTGVNAIIGILFTASLLFFLWGATRFIAQRKNLEARARAKDIMIRGIVGVAIMAATWGIITILVTTLGIPTEPPIP